MKKNIVYIVSFIIIVFICLGIYRYLSNSNRLLIEVMNSERAFVDEQNNKVLFKDYEIATAGTTTAQKYTFVDLDRDGIDELAVYTTSHYGAYMIFRYDNENKNIYGYMIGIRAFEELKTDGSFIGSNGAASNSYFTMSFDKNKKILKTEAINDQLTGTYEINAVDVSEEEISKYVEDWNKKEKCIWITDDIKKIEKLDNTEDYVGIYYNENWNGREATLILNKDGTCKYPTGTTNCKWLLSENVVLITIINTYEEKANMQIFIEDNITEEKRVVMEEKLKKIEGIDWIEWQENKNAYKITIVNSTLSNQIYNTISTFKGVKSIIQNKENIKEIYDEHEALIVNNGLILHDHFFKKMN